MIDPNRPQVPNAPYTPLQLNIKEWTNPPTHYIQGDDSEYTRFWLKRRTDPVYLLDRTAARYLRKILPRRHLAFDDDKPWLELLAIKYGLIRVQECRVDLAMTGWLIAGHCEIDTDHPAYNLTGESPLLDLYLRARLERNAFENLAMVVRGYGRRMYVIHDWDWLPATQPSQRVENKVGNFRLAFEPLRNFAKSLSDLYANPFFMLDLKKFQYPNRAMGQSLVARKMDDDGAS